MSLFILINPTYTPTPASKPHAFPIGQAALQGPASLPPVQLRSSVDSTTLWCLRGPYRQLGQITHRSWL